MTIRSQISSILGLIEPEPPELFALELKKIALIDFGQKLQMLQSKQSALNLTKVYITIRSWMSLIIGLIGLE